jgi:hypothetical protein
MAFVTDPVQTGNGMSRRDFVAGLAALGVVVAGGLGTWGNEALAHAGLPPDVKDAVTHRAYDSVKSWTEWLSRNGVRGYLGETNWPSHAAGARPDVDQWDALGEKVYSWLDRTDVWATGWTAGITQTPSIWKMYSPANPEALLGERILGRAESQSRAAERHPSYEGVLRGVNANGGELHLGITDEQYSNENSGVYGQHYVYPRRESLAYLAGRGHKLIRLPFLWERVQPTLGGSLDETEISRLKRCVTDAEAVGLAVVLDCHNYAAYAFSDGRFRIGTSRVSIGDFADLWGRLSAKFVGTPGIAGYDLMNEPQGMTSSKRLSPQQRWESTSQAAVTAIRNTGDRSRIFVAGYHKADGVPGGGVHAFVPNHPRAWINDPADKTFYTTHGYWGHYGYDWTYNESNAYWASKGY